MQGEEIISDIRQQRLLKVAEMLSQGKDIGVISVSKELEISVPYAQDLQRLLNIDLKVLRRAVAEEFQGVEAADILEKLKYRRLESLVGKPISAGEQQLLRSVLEDPKASWRKHGPSGAKDRDLLVRKYTLCNASDKTDPKKIELIRKILDANRKVIAGVKEGGAEGLSATKAEDSEDGMEFKGSGKKLKDLMQMDTWGKRKRVGGDEDKAASAVKAPKTGSADMEKTTNAHEDGQQDFGLIRAVSAGTRDVCEALLALSGPRVADGSGHISGEEDEILPQFPETPNHRLHAPLALRGGAEANVAQEYQSTTCANGPINLDDEMPDDAGQGEYDSDDRFGPFEAALVGHQVNYEHAG